MFETVACIVGLILFVLYNLIVCTKIKKIPDSISETAYELKNKYGTYMPFCLLCIISAMCIWPLWISSSTEELEFLVYLSCCSIIFVGVTPLYKLDVESKIHYTCGITAFISELVWLILMKYYIAIIVIAGIGGILTVFKHKKYIFIFEVISYVVMCLTLILKKFLESNF